MAEGQKCVEDLLNAYEVVNILTTERWILEHPELRNYSDHILIDNDMIGISHISTLTNPTEIIGIFKIPEYDEKPQKLDTGRFYLLLDEIQDPGNLGTIIRTCDWFGVYKIFASRNTADVYNPKVVQATMGSLSRVKVIYSDLDEIISKNPNFDVIGTLLEGKSLNECETGKGGLIIMGNEGRGISEILKKRITLPVTIPPANPLAHPDSLNVSIATAITLSHFIRR